MGSSVSSSFQQLLAVSGLQQFPAVSSGVQHFPAVSSSFLVLLEGATAPPKSALLLQGGLRRPPGTPTWRLHRVPEAL
eukprot:4318574-Alexandrium_andersonii.AAC.1